MVSMPEMENTKPSKYRLDWASSVWEMHRPFMLVSFRRCCQASMNALFAMEAKLNSQDGPIVVFETYIVFFKTNSYTGALTYTEKGVDHGGCS